MHETCLFGTSKLEEELVNCNVHEKQLENEREEIESSNQKLMLQVEQDRMVKKECAATTAQLRTANEECGKTMAKLQRDAIRRDQRVEELEFELAQANKVKRWRDMLIGILAFCVLGCVLALIRRERAHSDGVAEARSEMEKTMSLLRAVVSGCNGLAPLRSMELTSVDAVSYSKQAAKRSTRCHIRLLSPLPAFLPATAPPPSLPDPGGLRIPNIALQSYLSNLLETPKVWTSAKSRLPRYHQMRLLSRCA